MGQWSHLGRVAARLAAMRRLVMGLLCVAGCALEPHPGREPEPDICLEDSFAIGDDGHDDVFGAKAAGQARAGRITDLSEVAQPAHGRQQIEAGDFVLANDSIAVVIEDGGLSDGYGRFGGEILAVDEIGDDGRMTGKSRYLESLFGIGVTMADPSSVSVLRDGADGGEAVVRVVGRTRNIPFVEGPLTNLLPSDYDLEVALDYVLAPGEPRLLVQLSIANDTPDALDFGAVKTASDELYGFFHASQSQLVTPEYGFDSDGYVAWLGFVGGPWSFAWRSPRGPLEHGLDVSGFTLFAGPGFGAEPCSITTTDLVEVIAGGPYYDGLREAVRRVDGEPAWRAVSGTVTDSDGTPVADAYVHALDEDELYLSRARSDTDGRFTIHGPPGAPLWLVAEQRGHRHDGLEVAAGEDEVTLAFAPHATIHVSASALGDGTPLPVRIQVIPSVPAPQTPDHWGVEDERDGRLHQHFSMNGDATLVVPPGEHRVIVSRGYEYELHDETVTVAAGETAQIDAVLEHSVDTSDYLCADFHIHSFMSPDSSDPIDYKVRGAVADGLDIPVSSEHEWVVDFQPVIEALGVERFAFGMPASEMTTFRYGHFGVVPLTPQPGAYNNGAIDWVSQQTPGAAFDAVDERPEQPALIVNHPSGGSFQAYFSTVLLDDETAEPGYPELWSENFDAVEVFNDASFDESEGSVAHWFALLNKGLRVYAVGNSDSHHLVSKPAGYPRTCFFFGHDDVQALSHEVVRDAIKLGRGNVSGGLFMKVEGPLGELPGETVAAGTRTFSVSVESPSWFEGLDLEVYVRGERVRQEPLMPVGTGTSHRYLNLVALDLAAGDWVVFHARGAGDLSPLHPGRRAFAVSNPIFVE